jgi:hypothetical protein
LSLESGTFAVAQATQMRLQTLLPGVPVKGLTLQLFLQLMEQGRTAMDTIGTLPLHMALWTRLERTGGQPWRPTLLAEGPNTDMLTLLTRLSAVIKQQVPLEPDTLTLGQVLIPRGRQKLWKELEEPPLPPVVLALAQVDFQALVVRLETISRETCLPR